MTKDILTIVEASKLTGIKIETLKKRCQSNLIPGAIKKGKTWLIPQSSLAGFARLRSGVFMDGSNIFWSEKEPSCWPISFRKFKKYLKNRYSPVFYNYYGCENLKPSTIEFRRKADGQLKFYNILEGLGYNVITKALKHLRDRTKCDMDVEISIDVKNSLKDVDKIILVSGDSDFLRLVSDCHSAGKHIQIYSFEKTLAWELKVFAIKNLRCSYTLLDSLKSEIEFLI